jgi:hypothetical protein
MAEKIHTAFALGLMIARAVHGIKEPKDLATANAVTKMLEQVASGELTLLSTPGETFRDLPFRTDNPEGFDPRLIAAARLAFGDVLNQHTA